MMKTLAIVGLLFGAMSLAGCSGGDESVSSTPANAGTATTTHATDPDASAECSAPGTTNDPTVPLSPVAKCVGFFKTGSFGEAWLHRTPTGCMWGFSLILAENGAVTELDGSKRTGRWEGDEYHFTVSLGDSRYGFNRAPQEPSK